MPLLECPDISNRKIVLINLAGGNDGLNTIIPIDQYADYYQLRPNLAIPDNGKRKFIPGGPVVQNQHGPD